MIPDLRQIPDRVYFRIGEVSELVGVEPHVLRYWESEFALIKPFRGKSKQRLYRRKDLETLLLIRDLVHRKGYTIAGAKRYLSENVAKGTPETDAAEHIPGSLADTDLILLIKDELRAILQQLSSGKNAKS
jgi:DNA-binding transcriptional MerR regulator